MKSLIAKVWFLLLLSVSSFAQSYLIKGSLVDTTGQALDHATVFLLNPSDSTMVTYTRTDNEGKFEFKNVKKTDHILQCNYMGYLPIKTLVKFEANQVNRDLGKLVMQAIDKELFEVVVRMAKAPMSFKGDTIEYDASKFKVPPGSTVEDLLKLLPGFDVDAEGNVKAQGERVAKVLVDGKRFFGNDTKTATRNLPSEAVSKVQVYNDATEQAKLTGLDDGKNEKTVNLELKEDYKKGRFGKLTVGAGSEERVLAKGNYNRFNDVSQLSFVGFGNNINQSGLSMDDYYDFQTTSTSSGVNVDFGFDSGGVVFYSSDDDSEESLNLSIPQSWSPDAGKSKNFAAGVNYNYEKKKNKFIGNYFFNKTDQTLDQNIFKQVFLNNTSYTENKKGLYNNEIGNHRGGLRYDTKLDSLRSLIVFGNFRITDNDTWMNENSSFFNVSNENFRKTNPYAASDRMNSAFESSAVLRNRFMKPGRSFLLSATYGYNNTNGEAVQRTDIEEILVGGEQFPIGNENVFKINQLVLGKSTQHTLKSSAQYIEPLSKKLTWDMFLNLSKTLQSIDRDVYSPPSELPANRNDLYSVYFDNDISYERLGTSLRLNQKGFFGLIGLTAQATQIDGKALTDNDGIEQASINNNFTKLMPAAKMRYRFNNGGMFTLNYDMTQNMPTIRQLQPYIDNSNPMFITAGNPNLKPSVSNDIAILYNYYDQKSLFNILTQANLTFYDNRIVYNRTITSDLITFSSPENIKGGGYASNAFVSAQYPIIKPLLFLTLSGGVGFSESPLYINQELNTNTGNNHSYGWALAYRPAPWMIFTSNFDFRTQNNRYSIFKQQNQTFHINSISSNLNIQLPKLIFIGTKFDYSHQKNDRIQLNRHVPVLNLNVNKVLGKKHQHELRLSVNDLFNKNLNFNQQVTANEVSFTNTATLSRYVMLSYSFNMRGQKIKLSN